MTKRPASVLGRRRPVLGALQQILCSRRNHGPLKTMNEQSPHEKLTSESDNAPTPSVIDDVQSPAACAPIATSSEERLPDPSRYDGIAATLQRVTSQWKDEDEDRILEPYNYLLQNPGQNFRSLLIQAFDIWLRCSKGTLIMIDKAVVMAHTSSLMIDDIEDGSDLRRGKASAHIVYGTPMTINSANYVYILLFDHVRKISESPDANPRPLMTGDQVQRMLVDEMLNLHRGQGMELYWRDTFVSPTEDEYIAMVSNKTAGLFRILIKLMISQSTALRTVEEGYEIVPFLNMVGLLFQVRDDYLNLRSGDYTQNKGYCEDLTEGKFSFPIIHALSVGKTLDKSLNSDSAKDVAASTRPIASVIDQLEKDSPPLHVMEQQHTLQPSLRVSALDSTLSGSLDPSVHVGTTRTSTSSSLSEGQGVAGGVASSVTSAQVDERIRIHSHADFVDTLRRRPVDALSKYAIVQYMQEKTQSFRYCCEVMLRLDRQIRQELQKLEAIMDEGRPNEVLRGFIEKLRKGWYASVDCPPVGSEAK